MKTRRLLKASRLVELGACKGQVRKFRRLWGAQVYVTVPRMVAVANRFDWNWASRNLLGAAAQSGYYSVTTAALADYDRLKAATWPEWADYERLKAAAWATAYIQDGRP